MNCHNCGLFIGTVDFSIGPHHCPCGFVQLDEEGTGYHNDPSGGLWRWGDLVAQVTTKLGIKPCGGCGRRQRLLNRAGAAVREKLTR